MIVVDRTIRCHPYRGFRAGDTPFPRLTPWANCCRPYRDYRSSEHLLTGEKFPDSPDVILRILTATMVAAGQGWKIRPIIGEITDEEGLGKELIDVDVV